MANPLLVAYLIFLDVHIHSVTPNFLKTRRVLVFSNLGSFCEVLHFGFWWLHISSVDKLIIFRGLVFKVLRAITVHVIRWFGVHHSAWWRIPPWFCLSSTFPRHWGVINRNRILLEFNSGKSGMINSFIEHLVIVTDLLEFLVVFLDISWFQESCLLSLVHFFLGPLRARQFKVTVFVFE